MWIYLIRHGQTDCNRERIVQTPDTPLSILGQQQAQQLAKRFKQDSLAAILCSDHLRTRQTAEPLQRQLGCPLILSELLQERSFGELRGQAYADIQEDFFAQDYRPPGGEDHYQFSLRVQQAWQFILQQADAHEGNIAVITHGLVLKNLFADVLNLPEQRLAVAGFENTCVTQISQNDFSHLPLLCDTEHLILAAPTSAAV